MEYKRTVTDITGLVHDSAPVNSAAVRDFASETIVDFPCISHILSNCGKQLFVDTLTKFMKSWSGLFAHSHKAKSAWRARAQSSNPASSNTRWWTFWRQVVYVFKQWTHVQPFVAAYDGSDETIGSLKIMLSKPDVGFEIRLQMAVVSHFGRHYVILTHLLEGKHGKERKKGKKETI